MLATIRPESLIYSRRRHRRAVDSRTCAHHQIYSVLDRDGTGSAATISGPIVTVTPPGRRDSDSLPPSPHHSVSSSSSSSTQRENSNFIGEFPVTPMASSSTTSFSTTTTSRSASSRSRPRSPIAILQTQRDASLHNPKKSKPSAKLEKKDKSQTAPGQHRPRSSSLSTPLSKNLGRMSSLRSAESTWQWEPPSPTWAPAQADEDEDDYDDLERQLELQRRRLAKLTRTLGEQVPAELIMRSISSNRSSTENRPPSPTPAAAAATTFQSHSLRPKPQKKTLLRRTSLSLSTFTRYHSTEAVDMETADRSPAAFDGDDTKITTQTAHGHTPQPSVVITPPPRARSIRPESVILSPISFFDPRTPTPRSTRPHTFHENEYHDNDDESEHDLPLISVIGVDDELNKPSLHHRENREDDAHLFPPRSETPFLDSGIPEGAPDIPSAWVTTGAGVVRRERRQGWSGQWNQPDMQDVISKLRNLK